MRSVWRASRVSTSSSTGKCRQLFRPQFRASFPLTQFRFSSNDSNTNDTEPWHEHTHPRQRMFEQQAAKQVKEGKSSVKPTDKEHDMSYLLSHPIWSEKELNSVMVEHRKCKKPVDYLARFGVSTLRFGFDFMSGYFWGHVDEQKWLTRIVFLETVAGVPGMVAAMMRHLHSLRLMRRDYGWIHTLLEEAENERMHLLTAMKLKNPSTAFRAFVLVTQGLFVNFFILAYLVSPRFCHRFVGYLEEEAVVTYTKLVKEIDAGKLPLFAQLPAPDIAIRYWRLSPDAKFRDMALAMRADEAHHRDVNHGFADKKGNLTPNEWGPGR
eukprot:221743_1